MTHPIQRFGELLDRAGKAGIAEPNAMALATVGAEGHPSVRMVLLKSYDERGFVFYTNLESRKAQELLARPHAALCFHWAPLEMQVRIEGPVTRVSDAEADVYFDSRPRGSQIGAWASRQSSAMTDDTELRERVAAITERFAEGTIPRPDFWSGFRVSPRKIEFWSGKADRLHERELFRKEGEEGDWSRVLLFP